jgi:hypothetical protein
MRYARLFHKDSNDFKGTDVIEHRILTGDTRPTKRPQYRVSYALRGEMKTPIDAMLKKGVIRESNSPWSAPPILVPKKSPDGLSQRWRFCIDFTSPNSVTEFDTYPLLVFEEITSTLHGARYFSVLDCYSEFWQISIREKEKQDMLFSPVWEVRI